MKKTLLTLLAVLTVTIAQSQVKNTSYVNAAGEKVLRMEFVLPINRKAAWQFFTNDVQLQKWVAPVAHLELRTGGYLVTNYDKNKALTDTSSIKLDLVNYLDQELITFRVKLNKQFPAQVQKEDGHLQELIQFSDAGPGKTRVISSMIGWGKGEAWDKTYQFFVKGNAWTYEELLKHFKK